MDGNCIKYRFIILILLFGLIQAVGGQIRSGAAFLKMVPGTGMQAVTASHSSVIDGAYAMYANPAAAGFFREWQWSATYTQWIADVYHTGFTYSRRLRSPWSRQTNLALGVLYQGVPPFDSSDEAMPLASASDLMFAINWGQPLTFLTNNIALGGNLKYLKSNLDQYTASSMIIDLGLLARTPRFSLNNSFFEYGILAAGFAATQFGNSLKYDMIGTPLPQTWRAGVSFYAGSHHGMQFQIFADYQKVRDEAGAISLGGGFSWRQRFTLHMGYDLGNDLMQKASFGISISLDDVSTPNIILPGRNNSLKLEFASLDEGEFFDRTYRGAMTHHPHRPEYFEFIAPEIDASLTDQKVILKWERAEDPDLYDKVSYLVLVDADSAKLAQQLENSRKDAKYFLNTLKNTPVEIKEECQFETLTLNQLKGGGYYYWTVLAQDRDQHFRIAENDGRKILRFHIPYPDLEIEDIQFEPQPWITQDDYHGQIKIRIKNRGQVSAGGIPVSLSDKPLGRQQTVDNPGSQLTSGLIHTEIDFVGPGETKEVQLPWHTHQLGKHEIRVVIDEGKKLKETNRENNALEKVFYTIPKGHLTSADTVKVLSLSKVTLDMPIITDMSFDPNSTEIKPEYLQKHHFDPPLVTLAERLCRNRHLKIMVEGFADPNSGETNVNLANNRAAAVRDSLINLGVYKEQIKILAGNVLPRRDIPVDPTDAQWIFEERRSVHITADLAAQNILFRPVRYVDLEEIANPVRMKLALKSALPMDHVVLQCENTAMKTAFPAINLPDKKVFNEEITWETNKSSIRNWMNTMLPYYLSVTDSLGRTFRTKQQVTYVKKSEFRREHRVAFPLKFAKTEPMYSFYWKLLYKQLKEIMTNEDKRIRFMGHACAVGSDRVNKRLSIRRASVFPKGFMKYLKSKHPDMLKLLNEKLDTAKGYGEKKPLSIMRLNGDKIIIGDNNQALGRKLNRRIEVSFYATSKNAPPEP